MPRPLLLDLFCGAGGAAMGYHRAGFDVVGVDIEPQPHYPFGFEQMDALDYLEAFGPRTRAGRRFDAVHASPPCQAYSERTPDRSLHRDLIPTVRERLRSTGLPYVIENVEGAPLENPVRLCGTMFPELRVIRHRIFETNWPTLVPECGPHPLLYMPDKRRPHQGELDQMTAFVSVTGGGNCSVAAARDAMGIDWMTKDELNEAIPLAYTEYLGTALFEHLLEMAI